MSDGKTLTVLLTRSAEENLSAAPLFESVGLTTLSLPGIVIAEPDDWSDTDAAIGSLGSYDGVFFTSRNAVRAFLTRLHECRSDGTSLLQDLLIAAVGQKTEEELEAEHVRVDIVPEIGGAENLLASLDALDVAGKHFLFPKSSIARDILPAELRQRGAEIDEVIVYKTIPPDGGSLDTIRNSLVEGSIRCIAFFSPSGVRNITQMLGSRCMEDTFLAAIGPTTAAALQAGGLSVDLISPAPKTEEFARAIAASLIQS